MANEHIIGNDFQISGSLKVSQSITADRFYGDGSNLLYVTASTNWDGQYTGSAKITGSLEVKGGGVDFRLSTGVSGSFSGSFAGNGSRLTNLNINGTQASGSILTGSFSGSFKGDGSQLTGVQTVWSGQYSGSAGITGSINVSNTVTAANFTGSFAGDGSQLTGVVGGWNGTISGSAGITGSLVVSGSNSTILLKGDTTIDENILISNKGDDTSISIGEAALPESTQNRGSIALGHGAGKSLVTGSENIFLGTDAAEDALNIQNTIAIGYRALAVVQGQDVGGSHNLSDNIAIGTSTLSNLTTGKYNVAVGSNGLIDTGTGDGNTALGYRAGAKASIASTKNVYIGHQAGPTASLDESNKLYIGNAAGVPLIYGDFATKQLTIDSVVSASIFSGSFVGNGSGITGIVAEIPTASFVTTASFNAFTSSTNAELVVLSDLIASSNTGSFTGSFKGDGSQLIGVVSQINDTYLVTTSSFNTYTGSVASELEALTESLATLNTGSFSGSFKGDGSQLTGLITTSTLNAYEVSVATRFDDVNARVDTVKTGSFTGSFKGDGSQLTGLPTTEWNGLRSGSAAITGSLIVTSTVNALAVTSSFTGSFKGDGSNLTGIQATGWDGQRSGSASITGSLTVQSDITATSVTASAFRGLFTGSANLTGSFTGSASLTGSFTGSFTGAANLSGSFVGDGSQLTGLVSSGWDGRRSGSAGITGSLTVTNAVTASAFTGSFRGSFIGNGAGITGIISTNAVTASFAHTASLARTSSYAILTDTAEYAYTSSLSLSSREAITAETASLALSTVSASYALSASYVAQADFATTTLNVLTASVATTASYAVSAETATLANRVVTVDNPDGNAVYYSMFTDGTSGNTVYIDSDTFTYSANTNTLNVTSSYAIAAQEVQGLVTVSNNTDIASPDNAGALRYRSTSNSSFVDMVMQTGATTYTWVNIVQNNW